MAGKNNDVLKRDIAGAMYDLLMLKGEHTPDEANQAVKNTVSHDENITEHTLLRFLIRLQVAHINRKMKLPLHWTERVKELREKYPADARSITIEVKMASRLGKPAKKTKRLQPRRTKLR